MNNNCNTIKTAIAESCLLSRISLKRAFSNTENIKIIKDFNNAMDCIAYVESSNPLDIILMDLDLAVMNGIKTTRIIKKKFPDIKIIILASHLEKDCFAASMHSGASAFVSKNIDVKRLKEIINAVYIGAYWIDPQYIGLCREIFPKPDSYDLRKLYNKQPSSFDLTVREMEVLKLLVEGKSNSEIAKEIVVSTNTAKAHVGNILNKMHVTDRVQAAVMAVKSNII